MKRVRWLAVNLFCMAAFVALLFASPFVARTYRLAPLIQGHVLDHGRPAPAVPVRLTYVYPGSSKGLVKNTVTDAKGRFTVGPIEEFDWLSVPLGDPALNWGLELNHHDQVSAGWHSEGLGFPPHAVSAVCELDSKEHANSSIQYFNGQGICNFSTMK